MADESLARKVLVVDDEVKMCLTLRKLLELSNFEVEIAHNGDEALQKAKSFQPDCTLLDIRMPNTNGGELLKELKARYPQMAVIMTTAVATDESRQKCMEAGAAEYMVKPIKFQELKETIQHALIKSREPLNPLITGDASCFGS